MADSIRLASSRMSSFVAIEARICREKSSARRRLSSIDFHALSRSAIVWARTADGIRGFLVEKGTPGYTTSDIHGKLSMRAGKAETAYERTPSDALTEMDAGRAFKSKPYEWLEKLLTNRG